MTKSFGDFHSAIVMVTTLLVLLCVGVSLHVKRTPYFAQKPEEVRVKISLGIGFISVAMVAVVASWGAWGN